MTIQTQGISYDMKVKWLIENFVGDNGYEDLISEVRRQNMECIVLDIRNHFELLPNLIQEGECVMFQGSIQLFKKLKAELPVFPLGWMTDENYLCNNYYPHFQKFLFNDKHVFTTLAGLKHNKWWFYQTFSKEAMIYVRPNGGDKTFTGQLIDLQDFDEFFEGNGSKKLSKRYGGCEIKNTDLLVVSTPKNIIGEWRFICTNTREILGVSCYMYGGKRTLIPSAPVEATKLVNKILEVDWYPDPAFTVDIVQDNDGNFWLMELNSFTSAGTYASKKENIVKRVSEIAFKQWKENNKIN